jgi:transposase
MRFYATEHRSYCGVDLHARTLALCALDAHGRVAFPGQGAARPDDFLRAAAPYRDGLAVACECLFARYWLADLCAARGIPVVLGHALYIKAIRGGKAKNDRIDAAKIARLLRGGNLPQAHVYPKGMREARDLLRRRTSLVRRRAELLAHLLVNANSQYDPAPPGAKAPLRRQPRRPRPARPLRRPLGAPGRPGRPGPDRRLRRADSRLGAVPDAHGGGR